MIYWIFYCLMLTGYLGLTILAPSVKGIFIGVLLLLANAAIFWK